MAIFKHIVVISIISQCAAVSLQEQLEHVARRRLESQRHFLSRRLLQEHNDDESVQRRFYAPGGSILGVPSLPSHLPQAEPILPGHTLLRPALGMLKSAVKFPHREMENGAGVYGNPDNLGIRYDGLNERLLYTGFRRIPGLRRIPSNYIMILPQRSPSNTRNGNPIILIGAPVSIDSDHLTTDPMTLKEVMQNREETERAIKEFFKKADTNRNSASGNWKLKDDKPLVALRYGKNEENSGESQKKLRAEDDKDESSGSSSEEVTKLHGESASDEGKTEVEDKKTWFAKSKTMYNNIKINSHAPDMAEYMPVEPNDFEDLRNWWFYNQDDFKAFKDVDSDIDTPTTTETLKYKSEKSNEE
ncbi:uncharacterized protein LOC128670243 isoform X2 [Plodia interpunctella]|uniref:uncharacterized protein LOC128670243 isoform X2 n=1 Tax=Plodia interpunctella TaxID=58824 RepID=UPI002367CDA9|nr:uncharacterized protein LOC128670243 isoform X2 [Plodia interpunctella]